MKQIHTKPLRFASCLYLGLTASLLLPATAMAQVCNGGGVAASGVPPFTPAVSCQSELAAVQPDLDCVQIPYFNLMYVSESLAYCQGQTSSNPPNGVATCYTTQQDHDNLVHRCDQLGFGGNCLASVTIPTNFINNGWEDGLIEVGCGTLQPPPPPPVIIPTPIQANPQPAPPPAPTNNSSGNNWGNGGGNWSGNGKGSGNWGSGGNNGGPNVVVGPNNGNGKPIPTPPAPATLM
jgi:hypothetical protein